MLQITYKNTESHNKTWILNNIFSEHIELKHSNYKIALSTQTLSSGGSPVFHPQTGHQTQPLRFMALLTKNFHNNYSIYKKGGIVNTNFKNFKYIPALLSADIL